jgi:hypothetical protein
LGLPVSLDCLRPVSCLPNVTCVSGLSSSCVLLTQCCLCLWIVFVLCLVPNVACVSGLSSFCVLCAQCYLCLWIVHRQHWVNKTKDEDNPETQVTLGKQDTGRRQSRDTGNIVFVLCLVYPMLPVSLDCLRPVSCLPNVACVFGLSSSCVLFTQCCLCLWIVFVLGKQDTGRRQSRDTGNIGQTRHRTKTIQRHR